MLQISSFSFCRDMKIIQNSVNNLQYSVNITINPVIVHDFSIDLLCKLLKHTKTHIAMTSTNTLKPLNRTTAAAALRPEKIIQFGEGNFLRAVIWVNLFLENEFTITESIVTMDSEAISNTIAQEYQRATK